MAKGNKSKFESRNTASYKREVKKIDLKTGKKDPLIALSFKDFDRNQGQSFKEWEEGNLLSLAMTKLQEICQLTLNEAKSKQIIKQYTKVGFPPESNFYHPKHVPADVIWCSLHIQGKECVIGYFEDFIFQVVFLDKDHEFWITKKKNT